MINPRKVLVIVNSNPSYATLSAEAADMYVSARGLDPAHVREYDLGTSAVRYPPCSDIDDAIFDAGAYIEANEIEAVIMSAATPLLRFAFPLGTQNNPAHSISYFFGTSMYKVKHGISTAPSRPLLVATACACSDLPFQRFTSQLELAHEGIHPEWQEIVLSSPSTYNLSTWRAEPYLTVPYGRIGYSTFTLGDDDPILAEQHVSGALQAEREADYSNWPIHFGLHDRAKWIRGLHVEMARCLAVSARLPTRHYRLSYSSIWPLQPPADSYSRASMMAGLEDELAWGMIGSAILNATTRCTTPFYWPDSYKFMTGAWMLEATSCFTASEILTRGGSAAIGALTEPTEDGPPCLPSAMNALLHGNEMATVLMLCSSSPSRHDVWGDPLYRPFAKFTVNEVRGL